MFPSASDIAKFQRDKQSIFETELLNLCKTAILEASNKNAIHCSVRCTNYSTCLKIKKYLDDLGYNVVITIYKDCPNVHDLQISWSL